jgi:hypothetical protein
MWDEMVKCNLKFEELNKEYLKITKDNMKIIYQHIPKNNPSQNMTLNRRNNSNSTIIRNVQGILSTSAASYKSWYRAPLSSMVGKLFSKYTDPFAKCVKNMESLLSSRKTVFENARVGYDTVAHKGISPPDIIDYKQNLIRCKWQLCEYSKNYKQNIESYNSHLKKIIRFLQLISSPRSTVYAKMFANIPSTLINFINGTITYSILVFLSFIGRMLTYSGRKAEDYRKLYGIHMPGNHNNFSSKAGKNAEWVIAKLKLPTFKVFPNELLQTD